MRALFVCLLIAGLCATFAPTASAKKPDTPGNTGQTAVKSPKNDAKNYGNPGGHGNADKGGAQSSGGGDKSGVRDGDRKKDGNGHDGDRDKAGRRDDGQDRGDRDGRYDDDRTAEHLLRAGITALEAHRLAQGERLTGMDSLPPGIRKNLARGKPLPPGIAKKMVPGGMLGRLPVYPGYEWRRLGTDLVLVYLAQEVVADILIDVFR